MPTISLVVAMSENKVIGSDNAIPWSLKSDLQRFAKLTKKRAVVMGRKTHESILVKLGHPLKDRKSIIITRQANYEASGCTVVHSWDEALKEVQHRKEVFVIGGAEIYNLALPHATKLYLTMVWAKCAGDTFFSNLDVTQWELKSGAFYTRDKDNEYDYAFLVYERNL